MKFLSVVKDKGKNNKKTIPPTRRERHVEPRRISPPHNQSATQNGGDVNARRAHTPKSTSHTHDIPFRGTHVWHDFLASSNRRTGLCLDVCWRNLRTIPIFNSALSLAPIWGKCKRGNPVAPLRCAPGLHDACKRPLI